MATVLQFTMYNAVSFDTMLAPENAPFGGRNHHYLYVSPEKKEQPTLCKTKG